MNNRNFNKNDKFLFLTNKIFICIYMLSITEYINESLSIEEEINEGIIKDTVNFLKDNIKKIAVSAAVAASILNPASVKAVNIDASSSESPQIVAAQVMKDVHKTGDVPPAVSGIAKENPNDAMDSALDMLSIALGVEKMSLAEATMSGLITDVYMSNTSDGQKIVTLQLSKDATNIAMNKKNGDNVMKEINKQQKQNKKQDFSNDKEIQKIEKKIKKVYGKNSIIEFTSWYKTKGIALQSLSLKVSKFANDNNTKINRVKTGTYENSSGNAFIGYIVLPGN